MAAHSRVFEDHEAKRVAVPLMVGLVGPSGGGKTYSALRLASGIQRVTGGDIFVIDTESRRSLHYANLFKFRHVPFAAPFGPLDYLAAIEYAVKRGAKVVIVDSMSHEHEGPGGVLEQHAAEVDRLAGGDQAKAERVKMLAWSAPKQARRRMINTILQMPVSSIFCFRAKEKLKIERGQEPKPLGFMPIAGEEFIYEMTINCLLLPKAGGIPTWQSNEIGEQATMKLPQQFAQLFSEPLPLSEDHGETMARWAEGGAVSRFDEFLREIAEADLATLEKVIPPRIEEAKKSRAINAAEHRSLKAAYIARKTALTSNGNGAGEAPGSSPSVTSEAAAS
ncbi:MAG TPA: AAA family ATPase [Gemmatimonadaceae bacterium]|nr:AAA family ATPase [Gemmatimonadaceae bacterium]